MRIVLCGGGTCGHIMPNIALLPYLKKNFDSICYIGSANSMEERIAKEYDIPFYTTTTIKLERKKVWLNAKIPFILHSGVSEAKDLLNILKPNVVFSKGGYASLPTCLAARALDIPYVIHESDTTLGVANRLSAVKANKILLTAPSNKYLGERYAVVGNPIRDEIVNGNRNKLKIRLDNTKKTVLVVGGSLGAQAINETVEKAIPTITAEYNLIHIHGKNYAPKYNGIKYFPFEFVDNIGDYYDAADIIISRAGAGAIAEINAVGKRAIYIPLPKGNSRGDQEENAERQKELNRAIVLRQETLTPLKLENALKDIRMMPIPKPLYNRETPRKIVEIITFVASIKSFS